LNYRLHPEQQRAALQALHAEVGFARSLLAALLAVHTARAFFDRGRRLLPRLRVVRGHPGGQGLVLGAVVVPIAAVQGRGVRLDRFRQGLVYYWPEKTAQSQGKPPLHLRLLRVPGPKADVWLLTNVLDPRELNHRQIAQLYSWRWRNEGLFRQYKRMLAKMKLQSRTVKLVHREAEGSLIALQLLLALATQTQSHRGHVVVLAAWKALVAFCCGFAAALLPSCEISGPDSSRLTRKCWNVSAPKTGTGQAPKFVKFGPDAKIISPQNLR
jgi:hypothetical protein